jgi:type I restriction-modification system DNA methylase subunit
VTLPLNMFYNTDIATCIWVFSNRKPEHRQGKVQLMDAHSWFNPLRKNLGKKNCELSDDDIRLICETLRAIEGLRFASGAEKMRSQLFEQLGDARLKILIASRRPWKTG